jgi:hypothetical protein
MDADRVARIARIDHAHCMPPLFRSLLRMKKRPKLDVSCRFNDADLRWRGPDQLDIADQSVLLALIALAGTRPVTPEATSLASLPTGLRGALRPSADVTEHAPAVYVLTTWGELARWSGHVDRSSGTRQQMRASVRRLTEVTVWVNRHGIEYSTRLIAQTVAEAGGIAIALNPSLAKALCGGQYAAILLAERFALRSDIARALHVFLSSVRRPGETFLSGLPKLETHVWGDQAVGGTRRSRHSRLRGALQELSNLPGWGVVWKGLNVEISRPEKSPFATSRSRLPAGESGTTSRGNGNGLSGKRERPPSPKPSTGAGSEASATSVQGTYKNLHEERRRRNGAPAQRNRRHAPPHGGGEGVSETC